MNRVLNGTIFLGPIPWKWAKRSNIINFQFIQSQFQIFLNQTLRVFSQMRDIKHIRQDFHLLTWVMPQGWDLGVLGGQKLNFLNIVKLHIKLKRMISRPGYTNKLYPRIKLVTLGGVKRSNTIRFHRERGDLRWRAIEWLLKDIYLTFSCSQKSW